MINAGIHKDITWPDNWTAVTADGQRSAQFEHTLLITENGCEVLTKRLENSPKLEFLWLFEYYNFKPTLIDIKITLKCSAKPLFKVTFDDFKYYL